MADNTTLNVGSGGDVIATDDIGGVKYQIVKNAFGAADSVTQVAQADSSGLPVQVGLGAVTTGTLQALSDTIVVPTLGAPSVYFSFVNSAFSGTVLGEGSIDGGVTYSSVLTWQIGAAANSPGGNVATNANIAMANVAGMTHFRVRVSAFTSGSCVGTFRTSHSQAVVSVLNGSIGSLANTVALTPGTAATQFGKAEDAAHTSGDTGVAIWGVRQDVTTAAQTSNSGDYGYLCTDAAGSLRVTFGGTSLGTGAATQHRLISAASTNATSVKVSVGNVYRCVVANANAAVRFLKFYNKASAPTVGTDVPVLVVAIPAGGTADLDWSLVPHAFSTGIAYATTTGMADTDTGAVAASEIAMTLYYI